MDVLSAALSTCVDVCTHKEGSSKNTLNIFPDQRCRRQRQRLGMCIYQIPPPRLLDLVPDDTPRRSGIYFPEKTEVYCRATNCVVKDYIGQLARQSLITIIYR